MTEIVAVKLTNGLTLLGEMVDDNIDCLTLRDTIALKEMILESASGYSVLNVPHLYFYHGKSGLNHIKKDHIAGYDFADDYNVFYYESVLSSLIDNEMRKRKLVMSLYSGEQESQLQWDDEPARNNSQLDWGDEDTANDNTGLPRTVEELLESTEYEESINSYQTEEKITYH